MQHDQGDPQALKTQFWEALSAAPVVMLQLDADPAGAAPMTAQLDKDADGTIWFFTSPANRFAKLGEASATYVAKGHDTFARFSGTLSEETSAERKEALWSKTVEAWYPEGKGSALMLRMDLGDAAIWAGELGVVNTAKMLLGLNVRDDIKGGYAEVKL